MADAEWWVMRAWRVVDNTGHLRAVTLQDMSPSAAVAALAMLAAGRLAAVPPLGVICEPVEVFETENEAATHREVLARRFPGEEFRVVLNMEVEL